LRRGIRIVGVRDGQNDNREIAALRKFDLAYVGSGPRTDYRAARIVRSDLRDRPVPIAHFTHKEHISCIIDAEAGAQIDLGFHEDMLVHMESCAAISRYAPATIWSDAVWATLRGEPFCWCKNKKFETSYRTVKPVTNCDCLIRQSRRLHRSVVGFARFANSADRASSTY
jgi:hypothetical protein